MAHEDVLPYTTTEKQPLQHELFDKFLEHNPGQGNKIYPISEKGNEHVIH